MYHYLYKITNLLNNKIYIGIHSTNNLDDGYMGSSKSLNEDYEVYGIHNFKKEIIQFFSSRDELSDAERSLVDDNFIKRCDTYNVAIGGDYNYGALIGTVTVRDCNGKCYHVPKDDPRYLSGELIDISKGMVSVVDKNGKRFQVPITDSRYLSGELVSTSKGMINVKNKQGKIMRVSIDDSRYLSGELIPILKGKHLVKDKEGNVLLVDITDERYISGELVSFWKGRKHSKETIQKLKQSKNCGNKNSHYGTCWIYNEELKENKAISKDLLDDFIKNGWKKGRKMLYYKRV